MQNDLFLRTLRSEKTERPPVWFMRQAGRFLPDYRKLREKYSFFERVQNPELAAIITTMPVEQVDVDAAILFSDILVITQALGMQVLLEEGKGPVIPNPVSAQKDIDALDPSMTEERLAYASPAIKAVKQALNDKVPLIGFCGSPWTLLCYMVEGKGSKDFSKAKSFCARHPEMAHALLQKITDSSIKYLHMQVDAGVNALQVFDSWGGMLSPEWYNTFSLPYMKQLAEAVNSRVPVILFAKGCWYALDGLKKAGASALGLDWTVTPAFARSVVGNDTVLQGNLDPAVLLGTKEGVEEETRKMIRAFGTQHYIVNLGHGVLPDTPVENTMAFVQTVKTVNQWI